MYLSHLHISRFRKIHELDLKLNPGLNLIVGENDSGKSAIVDAVKMVTGTHSNDWWRLCRDDFYFDSTDRANEIKVVCTFSGLSVEEQAAFLEWLSVDGTDFYLKLTLTARRKSKGNSTVEIFYDIRAGEDEESGVISGEAKNKLRVTYMKPLRDAEYELAPRKGSRLSQILGAYEIFQHQENVVHPLVETMNRANDEITGYFETNDGKIVSDTINTTYLKEISLASNPISSRFGIAPNELGKILEKLELSGLSHTNETNLGLGSNNLLFMAAEMLLLKKESGYIGLKLTLIEEIEAHIHPQAQINLIDFLQRQCGESEFQTIITTHSNSVASKISLEKLIICKNASAFSLAPAFTKLAPSDYRFLSRFLDDTKANLFFACGVMLVEGDAENLILPALAEKLGKPLHKHGVSIVKVGSLALLRYAGIFKRQNGDRMGIKVSCVTDRDIPPKAAGEYTYTVKKRKTGIDTEESLLSASRKTEDMYTPAEIDQVVAGLKTKYEEGDIRVFAGRCWTLEYELACSILRPQIHLAITLAKTSNNGENSLNALDYRRAYQTCEKELAGWVAANKSSDEIAVNIYAPLERKLASKAITAQIFAFLLLRLPVETADLIADGHLTYLIDAINHATAI
jgi:putative ATP-dependent endonuclease of OLD family